MPFTAIASGMLRCEQPVSFRYKDSLFYAFDPTLGFERVYEPEDLLLSFESCAKAIQAYLASQPRPAKRAEVIPIRKRA
jgi:hypothetical protein